MQVNINGIKNKLEELKLLIHDTHADIITIQETKITQKQTHPKYITSPPCMPIGCTRQEVCSLHSLETTLHSLQQTYLRPSIYTSYNFKWSRYTLTTLNMHITIANIDITPRDSTYYKQLTRTHNTENITSQTYHTYSSPEM